MRFVQVGLLLLAGCIGASPRDPEWRRRGDALGTGAGARQRAVWHEVGRSVEGRPLRLLQLGHGPRRVLWVGGIHGNEREGHIATAELPAVFAATPGAGEAVTLTILEDVNPDGSAANSRTNKNGVDLNRNYPANNYLAGDGRGERPLDQPEARVLHDLILDERPHLVIVAHSWRGDHFINFDGPAEGFAKLFAARSGYRVHASDKFAPTPGSLGSWVGRKLGIPILTLEYLRGIDPRVAWMDTREAILAVILATGEPATG